MRGNGITYDTGFVRGSTKATTPWNLDQVAQELRIIRDDLHCTAVRITGGDPERIEAAAGLAVALGLEVWFSPYPLELPADEMLTLFADCAGRAERLRARGGEVVFVTGAELILMNPGFLPGADLPERLASIFADRTAARGVLAEARTGVNRFLADAVALVRERFGGKITYASIYHLENVDWTLFDFVSADLYRSAAIDDRFAKGVRGLVRQGKPVAITEFGSATFRGAPDRGAQGLEIVENDPDTGAPLRLDGEYSRDEAGQATYVRELLEIFDAEGVDTAFVFAFALRDFPHRPDGDPRLDLDLASYGIVKVYEDRHGETYPGLPWEPKAAFAAVADFYRSA